MAQTDVAVKWGFLDSFGLKEYAGLQYAGATPPTLAAAATFVGVLAGLSEAAVCRIEANSIDRTEGVPAGDNASHYVATILFQQSGGDWKPSITIPAVEEASLVRDGKTLTLDPAAVASVKSALETLTGKTFLSNPKVMVYTRR